MLDERLRIKNRIKVKINSLILDQRAQLDPLIPSLLSEALGGSVVAANRPGGGLSIAISLPRSRA